MLSSDNISVLFGSLGNKSAFSGVDLTQYSLIKSGAYGKALKAYYAEQKTDSSSASSTKKTNESTDSTAKTITSLKSKADSLTSSLNTLASEDLWKDAASEDGREKITSAVNGFINAYNEVLDESAKVNSSDVSNQRKYMTGMTSAMSNSLSKIGITIDTEGKLSVNKDKLDSASTSEIQKLFNGNTTYGSMINGYSESMAKAAVNSATTYTDTGAAVSSLSSLFDTMI